MKKIYSKSFVMLLMLTILPAFVSAQRNLLFIGREGTPDGFAMDRDCYDSLASWGYTLTYIDNSAYSAATADVYTGQDGVFMSETVNSGDMNNFAVRDNYPLPIINLEGYTPRDTRWNWLTDNSTQFHQAATGGGTEDDLFIVIKDNSHYITQIYGLEDEVRWSDVTGTDIAATRAVSIKEANVTYSAKLAKNRAIANEEDFWTMITVDKSETIPNKIFIWGMVGTGLNGESLTEHKGTQDFFTIIKRACEWAFDLMPNYVDDHRLNAYRLIAFPNPASEKATIRFNAPFAAKATVTLHNITGQQLEVLADKSVVEGNNFVFLDVTNYSPGVYLIRLIIEEKEQYTKLIIN
ncbi:MAG: T9SS type A sorting domain-containing protein [Bacteroidales bacterium]|nr:T9SS type A sorting domain-containing protein [Bacteroidales bacterium]